jgi:hypothetical protein
MLTNRLRLSSCTEVSEVFCVMVDICGWSRSVCDWLLTAQYIGTPGYSRHDHNLHETTSQVRGVHLLLLCKQWLPLGFFKCFFHGMFWDISRGITPLGVFSDTFPSHNMRVYFLTAPGFLLFVHVPIWALSAWLRWSAWYWYVQLGKNPFSNTLLHTKIKV